MDPSYNNSFGQFGSGVATNNTGWTQNDVVMNPVVESKKRFSWKTIIAIVGGVIAVIVAVAITKMVIYNQSSSREEIYTRLWNFYYDASYQDLIEEYSLLDEERLKHNNPDFILSISSINGWIEGIRQGIESSQESYKELKKLSSGRLSGEEKRQFDLVKINIKDILDIIEKNIDTVSNFYDTFAGPLNTIYGGGCNKTTDIDELINGYTDKIVSEKYFFAYCKVIEFYKKSENIDTMPDDVVGAVQEFVDVFNTMIVNIDDYFDDDIREILNGFESINEKG